MPAISLLAMLALAARQRKMDPNATWIAANDPKLRYNGRVGFEEPGAAKFYYSASGFKGRFTGTSLALRFKEDDYGVANTFGIRIDGGVEIPLRLIWKTEKTYVVAVGLADKLHDLEVYRRQDTYGGMTKFEGLWLDKGAHLGTPPTAFKRKIECFGDSVMSGYAATAVGYEGQSDRAIDYDDTEGFLNNGYWGFGAIAARRLKAEANIQGIAGIALLDHTGYVGVSLPNAIGLVSTWDKLDPLPGQFTQWDFSRFTPDVVVLSVGQNDHNGWDIKDPGKRKTWKEAYKGVLAGLQSHYPKATFVFTTTLLRHDLDWDAAIKELVAESHKSHPDQRVSYFAFKRTGQASYGHPRIAEQMEMGQELADYLEHLAGAWGG